MYLEYRPLLLYLAARKFHVPAEDCEPLVQEALVSFLMTDVRIENPKAWLVAAVCNASRQYWRRRERLGEVEGERIDEVLLETAGVPDVGVFERGIVVRALLAHLRPKEREVLRLHYFEGHTAAEIADVLGTTAGYAEKLICKALRSMRSLYEHAALPDRAVARRRASSRHAGDDPAPRPVRSRIRAELFLHAHGIPPRIVGACSGLREPQLSRVLRGACAGYAPRARVLMAVRRITGRNVRMDELFDARPDDGAA